MAKPVRQAVAIIRAIFPDLPDWPESPVASLLAFSAQPFRVEELERDGHYVIRAELPGLDPASDIEVTVDGRILTIYAERWQKDNESRRTEFRYGPLTRSVRLPARVDAQDITARYLKGILEVSVPVPTARPEGSRIPIEDADASESSQETEAAAGSTATAPVPGAPARPTPPPVSRPA
jgi:HSP20 family protein